MKCYSQIAICTFQQTSSSNFFAMHWISTLLKLLTCICNILSFKVMKLFLVFRIDCFPETVPQIEEHCLARGCCYDPHIRFNDDVPWCFYPSNYPTYQLENFMVYIIDQLEFLKFI